MEQQRLCDADVLEVEILERAVRIHLLVGRSVRHLGLITRRKTAQTASSEQIRELLEDFVIRPLLEPRHATPDQEHRIDKTRHLLATVAAVHEYALPTVPRVIEPIELHSYLRQSGHGELDENRYPLIFGSDALGTQVYPNSLNGLIEYVSNRERLRHMGRHSVEALKEFANLVLPAQDDMGGAQGKHAYISLPVIDIGNPLRWPSLWHEWGHHKLKDAKSVIERFEEFVGGGKRESAGFRALCIEVAAIAANASGDSESVANHLTESDHVEIGREVMDSWLRECWCDAFGVSRTGLAFLYSQLHDFMFCVRTYLNEPLRKNQMHPPAEFRLRLAKNLAIERLQHSSKGGAADVIEQLVTAYGEEELLFTRLAGSSGPAKDAGAIRRQLNNLLSQFLAFLKKETSLAEGASLGADVSTAVFSQLEADLTQGLPIPAIPDSHGGAQRPTTVAEISLAGWRHRNTALRRTLSGRLVRARKEMSSPEAAASALSTLVEDVGVILDRSDESMKRSIQVAEWFSLLHDKSRSSRDVQALNEGVEPRMPGLLTDTEIHGLLSRSSGERLRVIPLINVGEQIKGSVMDVRLGHNFEVFQSLIHSNIDVVELEGNRRPDSFEVEIDRLQGLPVLPGQFVLGHTLEYIKLPNNVAAQIEGRSSFARLGIQVHMTANLVEAGFDGCLTLEIHNNGPSTVVLYPGMRIAQLRFFLLAREAGSTYSRPTNKYRGQLSQNKTKQFSDPEVGIFRDERNRLKEQLSKKGGAR